MFGKRISDLRKERGLTQLDLAQKIGVTRSAISLYEIEKREPDTETLLKMADFFGVSTDYLLGYSKNRIKEEDLEWRYPHVKNRIGSIISKYREEFNLSSKEFAKKMGISVELEQNIEAGINIPSLKLLSKMATEMNMDVDYLIGAKTSNECRVSSDNSTLLKYSFDIDNFFFARFEEICLSNSITSENCIEKIGIDKEAFSDIRYNRLPTLEEFLKISYSLDVSLDYLIGRTDIPLVKLSDDELSLLLNFRDCAPQYQKNILDRAEKLSIESIDSSVAAEELRQVK